MCPLQNFNLNSWILQDIWWQLPQKPAGGVYIMSLLLLIILEISNVFPCVVSHLNVTLPFVMGYFYCSESSVSVLRHSVSRRHPPAPSPVLLIPQPGEVWIQSAAMLSWDTATQQTLSRRCCSDVHLRPFREEEQIPFAVSKVTLVWVVKLRRNGGLSFRGSFSLHPFTCLGSAGPSRAVFVLSRTLS